MPTKIFLVGMMGSGKSHWAAQLAKALGFRSFDLDQLLETQEGKTVTNIFAQDGETYFREAESNLLRSFASQENFILATGGGTACFGANMEWMNQQGLTIWMDPSIPVLAERLLNEKQHRPLIASLADADLAQWLTQKRAERRAYYQSAQAVVTDTHPHLPDLLSMIQQHG
jgi:shikimate kinase